MVSRPLEASSIVIKSFASNNGWRKLGVVTSGPRRMVDVASLTAANNGTVSYTLPKRGSGVYKVQATFTPSDAGTMGSTSSIRYLLILF